MKDNRLILNDQHRLWLQRGEALGRLVLGLRRWLDERPRKHHQTSDKPSVGLIKRHV